ncbi:hypothetical protein M977_04120 [Buttiauxella gaviniae ATCC 51604]|uniref:Uncharacterized protein n=1 Tax=Buttiauxella gaviniae ATCC 51604 TaxID=1354253 RepID=A0A1B7HPD6_9ENTR|nr:hypothetical protein [Buttiauxella gaviniae]OAT17486.1 hypothetical protein M977_04120 [Buttiauxella gaviniae ATCC 51604]
MTTELKLCPKGKKPKITTREPRGYWCVMGYKNITCPCGCLRETAAYTKGGQAWCKAEAKAIEQWNREVMQYTSGMKLQSQSNEPNK